MEKWSALAGLRFLLASVVAVAHLAEYSPLGAWAVIPRFGAFEAVLGFLLISGYSIASSYAKEPEGYLWRRIKRIYPIYLASMLLAGLVYVLDEGTWPSAWTILGNVLFLNQLLTQTSLVGPAWSLSLEFWLYCLAPFLFTLRDGQLRWLVLASFGAYVFYTCGRTLFHWRYYSGLGYGLNLPLLSFIWLAGFRIAKTPEKALSALKAVGVILALHVMLEVAIQLAHLWKHGQLDTFLRADATTYVLRSIGLGGVWWVFFRSLKNSAGSAKPVRWMRALGDISYPLYLIHIPVYALLKRNEVTPSPLLYFGMAVLVSWLLYRGLDFYSQRRHLRVPLPDKAVLATSAQPGTGSGA